MIGFGKFGKRRDVEIVRHPRTVDSTLDITSLEDNRLLLVDPTREGFFDKVLSYKGNNHHFIPEYIKAIREVQEAELEPFWRPVMDPSFDGKKIIYKMGKEPLVNASIYWINREQWDIRKRQRNLIQWMRQELAKMPSVEGKQWHLGSEYQYYADEVDLINKLVDKGYDLEEALCMVVIRSEVLGHYANSVDAKKEYELTGSREVCGRYDLNNTRKILACTNHSGYWEAACYYGCDSRTEINSLARLEYINESSEFSEDAIWWWIVK